MKPGHRDGEPRGAPWTSDEDADIIMGRRQGKTVKGIAMHMPHRTIAAVGSRVRMLCGKRPRAELGIPIRLSMRLPPAFHEVWTNESRLLGMTLARYIREKLVGGR